MSGPFDFVVEGEKPVSFGSTLIEDEVFGTAYYPGYKKLIASHGGLPFRDETSTLIACGPNVKQGIKIERRSIVDEAPTMAAMLDFDLENVDGEIISEMLD